MRSFANLSWFVIENIPNPLIVFNSNGDVVYANESGDRFIKKFFKEDNALKKFLFFLYNGEESPEVEEIKIRIDFKVFPVGENSKLLFIEEEKSLISPSTFIEFFSEISEYTDIGTALQRISEFLLYQLRAGKVTIFLYDEREKVYKRVTLITNPPFSKEHFKKNVFSMGEGITGKVIETGVTFYAPNVDLIEDYYRSSPFEKCEVVVPIKDEKMVYGTIGVGSDREDAFTEEDIKMIERVARWILFMLKTLYIYQDILKEKKGLEMIRRIPYIFKGEDLRKEFENFMETLIKEWEAAGGGVIYGNLDFWIGEGGKEFQKFYEENLEKILERHFFTEGRNFYLFPFENVRGYIVLCFSHFLDEREIENIESLMNFLEEFLIREERRRISSLHRKIFDIFLQTVTGGEGISKIYHRICEILNDTLQGEFTLMILKKDTYWEVLASYPEGKGVEETFISFGPEENITENYITFSFEDKNRYTIFYISSPKKIHSVEWIKSVLEDYLKIVFAMDSFQKTSILLSTIRKMLEAEISLGSLKDYFDEICKIIKENLGYAFTGILLREGDYLKLVSAWGYEEYKDFTLKLKIGEEGLSGIAYKRGETIYSPDVRKDPFYVKVSDIIKSEVAIPLKTERGILGVIVISSPKPYAFSEEEISFLEALSDQISLFIQQRLEKEEKEEVISFLEEETKFSEMILRNLPIGVMVIDNNLRIKRVNDGLALLLKKELKNLIGLKVCDILCSHEPGGYCKIENAFVNRKLLFKEKFLVNVEGENVPMAVTSSFIYTSEDIINGMILMVEDIREVAKLEEQLRRTERLSAMGKIAAYMAHEIKNPLASISTGIEFIMEKLPPEENIKSYMNLILKEIYRLDRLIKNLLSFASRKPLNKVPVNISELLNECITIITPEMIGKEIELKTSFEMGDLVVRVDPDQFKEVVLNLVRNAIEAIEEKGEIEIGYRKLGNNFVLWCKDNGKGIREEYLHSIFEPFFSTKKGGSGLGLAIVHKIVEDHGGKIEVNSEYGKGSIFKISIPL